MELKFSDNSLKVLERRYLKKDQNGRVTETPEQLFQRVAAAMAGAEKLYSKPQAEVAKIQEDFFSIMANLEFIPNSPTLMNAARELGQLSACFVLPINDSMDSIFETLKATALIHKSGGGTGFSFSRLRPKNSVVQSTGGIASGPVSFLKVYDAATQAVKQGGCVEPKTRVSTEFGVVKIESLGPKKEVKPDTWHNHNGRPFAVATDEGLEISDEFYNNGVAKVKKIQTVCGYAVSATLEHRLRVIDEFGNYVWRHAKDLKTGDWVALQKDTYFTQDNYPLPKCSFKIHFNAQPIKTPQKATKQLGEFAGFFVGDGAMSINKRGTGRLIFTINDEDRDVRDYLCQITKELFGIKPVLQKKRNDKSTNYFFNSTVLVHWLKQIGIEKKSAAQAEVPEMVFRAGRDFAYGFLKGLFSADGYISDEGYISLTSVSDNLITDIQTLLLSLGLPSKIFISRKRNGAFGRKPLYRLSLITKAGVNIFKDKIGFISAEKNKRLIDFKEKAWEFNDIIPCQERLFGEIYHGPGRGCGQGRSKRGANRLLYRDIQHYLAGVSASRNLTRSRLKKLADKHKEIRNNPVMHWFIKNNQFYDRIARIEDGESLTLDLSVPNTNTYIANGFVSHNTRRGANMGILRIDHPDILEFITCKENNKDITNFNISIAITDDFMQKLAKNEDYDLIDPRTKQVVKRLNTTEVFNLIVRQAHKNGEPGVIFIDRMNEFNPTPKLGAYESTNPCITGDSLIPTAKGLVGIGRLTQDYPNGGIGILNSIGFFKPTRIFSTGVKEVFKVKTKAGYELKATANHPILTQRGWVKVKDLEIGKDEIKIQAQEGAFPNNKRLPFEVVKEFKGKNGRLYKTNLPSQWSQDLGILLGWLIGDGNLHGKRESVFFYFGKDDLEVLHKIKNILKDFYGRAGTLSDRGPEWQLSVESKLLFNFFEKLGIRRALAHDKYVPASIFTAPKEAVMGFLKGIFSSDGTINYVEGKSSYVRLSSASLRLLKEVQILLINLGIFSRIYENRKPAGISPFSYITHSGEKKTYQAKAYHELEISRQDVVKFIKDIGFLGTKNKKKVELLLKKYERKRGYYKRERFDVVEEIEPAGREMVYDLTEPATHSFIANGLTIHNCGEQVLLPYESCNLGSINLYKMVNRSDGAYHIDWERFKKVTHIAVRFLDNVIDVNKFPLDEIREKTLQTRKIGLGVMGWASLLARLGIPYNSDEAVALAEKIMSFILEEARKESIKLAKEKGEFPAFKLSIYHKKALPKQRNATLTTVAPTGTISIIAGPCSSGIEPIFAISYYRNVMDNDKLVEVEPVFEEVAKERHFYSRALMERIAELGSIQSITDIPEDVKRVFVTSHDISADWHIRMQAAFQKFTDNAVSKTINFPFEAKLEDVKKAYLLAYELGCKGVTIYRDLSREEQVLNIQRTETAKSAPASEAVGKISPRPRPEMTRGTTTKVATGCGNLYVTINEDVQGKPFEVFTQMGKAGGCAASQLEAIGRLVSLAMRSGLDIKSIIEQLHGIRCPSPSWEKGARIFSCADAIARVVEKRLIVDVAKTVESTVAVAQAQESSAAGSMAGEQLFDDERGMRGNIVGVCPDCGGALRHEEGCIKCLACGFSKC